jgi:hypothetical protein
MVNRRTDLTARQRAALFALLGFGIFIPIVFAPERSPSWIPDWLGAAMAIAALFGALLVFRCAGAMRAGYIFLFAVALAAAVALGQLLANR